MSEIILAVTPAEFSRWADIPKYTITRNAEKFKWAENVNSEIKDRILLTDENKAIAKEINSSRVTRQSFPKKEKL